MFLVINESGSYPPRLVFFDGYDNGAVLLYHTREAAEKRMNPLAGERVVEVQVEILETEAGVERGNLP